MNTGTFNAAYIGHAPAVAQGEIAGMSEHLALFCGIVKAVFNADLYEDGIVENPPSYAAILRASNVLGDAIDEDRLRHCAIDPHLGDINITWRNRQNGKRVKVTFAKNSDAILLYHEQTEQGRVIQRNMVVNPTRQELGYRVNWLYE
jgi:hypothetical protein